MGAIDDKRQRPDDFPLSFHDSFDCDNKASLSALVFFGDSLYMTAKTPQQMGQSRRL
jgi:hypothetical protein